MILVKKLETCVNLDFQQQLALKEIQDEIRKTGNNVSKSQLIAEAVSIMTSFYKEEVIQNFKKQKYYKK
jgi:hypothetical protein